MEKSSIADAATLNESIQLSQGLDGKFLTFVLGKEEYGIDIRKVREIIGMMVITRVPKTPGYLKGVINLRGKVVPIIDLRLKFRMKQIDYTKETCIVVVETVGMIIGTIVDSVSEVIDVISSEIEPAPAFGEGIDSRYILGMAKFEKEVKILIDIDKVLSVEELQLLDQRRNTSI